MKKTAWLWGSGALLALALLLRFAFSVRYPAYALGFLAVGVVVWHLRKNWKALVALLGAGAAVLLFALRGYAYWAYICLFVAALIVLHRFLPPFWWKLLSALVALGLVYFCIVEVPIIKNARTDREPGRDYLVVLGAAVYGDQPSLTLQRRLEGALDYLERYPDAVAIVSGGMGPGETVTEAQAMHDWLRAHGIAEERIILEEKATSTMENLRFSFELIRERGDEPDGNVALVSSAYHLYRAKQMAKAQGVAAAGVAAPWGYFFVMLNYFIREAFGVTHLWVFGY
ncbi:MAG: YdcF family protein [Oscillospiraceae bacterium]|nr:YdcF family protein [Oscillospiraceae bacterium]